MADTLETLIPADRKAPPTPISFEEFLAWALAEEGRSEWVDGEVVLMSPSNLDHQDVLGFLYVLISQFVWQRRLGRVFISDVLMRLATRPSGRVPDLLFVSNEHADRLRPTYLDGPADLVVEIVSPDSDTRDHGEKFAEYEAAGVPEYWLIDPLRREATFYRLGDDGRYHPGPIDADGFYRSSVLAGFRLQVAWLWQRPLPDPVEIMRQTEA